MDRRVSVWHECLLPAQEWFYFRTDASSWPAVGHQGCCMLLPPKTAPIGVQLRQHWVSRACSPLCVSSAATLSLHHRLHVIGRGLAAVPGICSAQSVVNEFWRSQAVELAFVDLPSLAEVWSSPSALRLRSPLAPSKSSSSCQLNLGEPRHPIDREVLAADSTNNHFLAWLLTAVGARGCNCRQHG